MAVLLDAERSVGDEALALDWSEEELEELVQRAMERSPLVDLADTTVQTSDSSISEKKIADDNVVGGGIAASGTGGKECNNVINKVLLLNIW